MGLIGYLRAFAQATMCNSEEQPATNQLDSTSQLVFYAFPMNEEAQASQAQIETLQFRVKELEARNWAERDTYRAIIAEMAAKCRALQGRIKILELGRSTAEGRSHVDARRRTWQLGMPIQAPPLLVSHTFVTSPIRTTNLPDSLWHDRNPGALISPLEDDTHIPYDDQALLMKAWQWF